METEVNSDTEQNILYIEHTGSIHSVNEAEQTKERILSEARKLDEGWYTISDIREIGSISPEVSEIIDNVQEELDNLGAAGVIRIVEGASSVSKMSFKVGGNFEFSEYEVSNEEEAKKLLKKIRNQEDN